MTESSKMVDSGRIECEGQQGQQHNHIEHETHCVNVYHILYMLSSIQKKSQQL